MRSAALSLIILLLFPQITYAYCSETARQCVDSGGTRVINGKTVTRDCFKYKVEYSCDTGGEVTNSQCDKLRDKGCVEKEVVCSDTNESTGRCTVYSRTFQCPTSQETKTNDCSVALYCQNGECYDTSYDANTDMGLAVAYMEAAREVAAYMDVDGKIFKGDAHFCRTGYGGIRDCCDKRPAAEAFDLSNQVMTQVALSPVIGYLSFQASYYTAMATPYVYDAIVGTVGAGFASFIGVSQTAIDAAAKSKEAFQSGAESFTPSVSYAGFGMGFGGVPTATIGTNYGMGSAFGGNIQFFFNPTMFLIFAAFMIYQSLSSCKQSEHMLALYRGSESCVAVPQANSCKKKIFGSCVETLNAFCCYNSPIGRILNVAVKQQFGYPKAYGKLKPNCDPISLTDLQRLNFTVIDFSDFIRSIAPGGRGGDFWNEQYRKADQRRTESQVFCSNYPTEEERAACTEQVKYTENDSNKNFSDNDGTNVSPDKGAEFWEERAMGRLDIAAKEGRPDVDRPPEDPSTDVGNKPYYQSEDNKGSD